MRIKCEKCGRDTDEKHFRYNNGIYCYTCEDELKRDNTFRKEELVKNENNWQKKKV
ncbi:MAG: hypothetical protein WAW67_03925 [Candidatus Omnitrophota bacterium]